MFKDRRFVIGYAFTERKRERFLLPSLIETAKAKGIDFVAIDSAKALIDQGPFDAILHKLTGNDWYEQLKDFSQKCPSVPVIDPPERIEKLHNRVSMFQGIADLKISEGEETLEVPLQAVIEKSEDLFKPEFLSALKFPVIAKPLVAAGSAESHSMSLILNERGLKVLRTPVVLQEFVNHGGKVFKVYVVGDYAKCVMRNSLPDVCEDEMKESDEGIVSFSEISTMPFVFTNSESKHVESPSEKFVEDAAKTLRDMLGLHLFNFDTIRDSKASNRFVVVDINYFPGYAKMPGFESVLTEFFRSLLEKNSGKI